MSGLTVKEYAEAKGFDLTTLTKLGVKDDVHNSLPAVAIPYFDPKGKFLFYRHRLALSGKMKFHQPSGTPLTMYAMQFLDTYDPSYIIVVEGESDAQTLIQHGLQAIGLPGAGSWKEDFVPLLAKFSTIYVVKEPDQGGETLLKKLTESKLADKVSIVGLGDCKDVSELYLADKESFVPNLRSFISKATDLVPLPAPRWSHEVTNKEFPPQSWVIQDIFAQPGLMVISGKEGTMKSFISLEIAMAVSSGTPLWGQFPTTQSGVMIIDYENTDQIFHDRMHALCYPNKPTEMPIIYHNETTIGGMTHEHTKKILRMCKKDGISLIIFDSLSRFLGDKEENSSTDMRLVFSNFKILANNGISCIFLHHNRKPIGFIKSTSSSDMRGSSDIAANLNAHWGIEKDEKNSKINIMQHKLREAEKKYQGFVLGVQSNRELGDLKFVFEGPIDEMSNKKEHIKEEITALLNANDGYLSLKEIKAALESSGMNTGASTLRSSLRDLVEEGVIKSSRGGLIGKTGQSESRATYYSITGGG